MWIPIFIILALFENVCFASGSTLTKPPQSALVVAFERLYEQSLLAYTLSDQNIDSTLLISSSSSSSSDVFENLPDVEIIKLNGSKNEESADKAALKACEILLSDEYILKRVREIQPTFVIFPALRHEACLIPWSKFINSIPVIVSYDRQEEIYVVEQAQIALPIHTGGILSGFSLSRDSESIVRGANRAFVVPALKLVKQYLPIYDEASLTIETLYSQVDLIMSSSDPILRTNIARFTEQPIKIGCHQCRGAHPLPGPLQKELVEFRQGTVAVTLDETYALLVKEIARKVPQGRQGLALAWKSSKLRVSDKEKPENLFIHGDVNRQDIIGYGRTRVLLSHCEETELLESIFHGTPVICFPRNLNEMENEERAIELGFGVATNGDRSVESVAGIIEKVHKTTSYREIARGYSSLMRDQPLPASDRIIYWLDYLARNANRAVTLPIFRANQVGTFHQVSLFLWAFYFGLIIGLFLGLGATFVWSKYLYRMRWKDKKFNR